MDETCNCPGYAHRIWDLGIRDSWGQASEEANLLEIFYGGAQDTPLSEDEEGYPGAFTVGSPTGFDYPDEQYDFQPMKLQINVPSNVPRCEEGSYSVKLKLLGDNDSVTILDKKGETINIDTHIFESSTPVWIHVEEPSQYLGDIEITATCNDCPAIEEDFVIATAVVLDLDIDSDNTNGFDEPDRLLGEGRAEDNPNSPGKLVYANHSDDDDDEVPDFADGFNWDNIQNTDDDVNGAEHFFPLILELPDLQDWDLAEIQIKLTYDASDPANVVPFYSETGEAPDIYVPGASKLRLWLKDGNVARNGESIRDEGDYVPAGTYQASELGFSNENGVVTFYIEGVNPSDHPGDQEIKIEFNIDDDEEFEIEDTVRVTVVGVELQNSTDIVWTNSVDEAFIEDDAQNNPQMPQLVTKLLPDGLTEHVQWNLFIYYDRYERDDEYFIPVALDETGPFWVFLPANALWDITGGEFQDDFRGGETRLLWHLHRYQHVPEQQQQFIFHVRGHNPEPQAARAYLDAHGPWYAYCIAKREGGDQNGRHYIQFNEEAHYSFGPDNQNHYKYCPNAEPGNPEHRGWGMMQLTRIELAPYSTDYRQPLDGAAWAQELWNWQANVNTGLAVLNVKQQYAEGDLHRLSGKYAPDGVYYVMPQNITVCGIDFHAGTDRTPDQLQVIARYRGDRFWTNYNPRTGQYGHNPIPGSYVEDVLDQYEP